MIDLKKPLEGAPGLLLLAALILFGATIGVSLALMFSWIEMKDSLANFLGGGLLVRGWAQRWRCLGRCMSNVWRGEINSCPQRIGS
jgi:hypothetical protein